MDYDEEAGLDADDWIERLKQRIGKRRLGMIWLPHDAKAKTFAASHAPVEKFINAFGTDRVGISPLTKKQHSINAGQVVMRHCAFHKTRCAKGLAALRAWAYDYDEERKQYSKEPMDDWAADASDAYCEGAKMLQHRIIEDKRPEPPRQIGVGLANTVTLDDLWRTAPKQSARI